MGYHKAQFKDHFYWGTAKLTFGTTFIQHFSGDLFLIHSDIDIANDNTDDNMQYLSAKNVEDVIESLEQASVSLFRWFENNLLKGNADKWRYYLKDIYYCLKKDYDINYCGYCLKPQ